ncbi:MAG: molybdopterin-dependent oxidoreductase [Actinomycetota bacterium]|nr:molybdopterin-dependent oxidoreductase [Actinomycetota bacterium]
MSEELDTRTGRGADPEAMQSGGGRRQLSGDPDAPQIWDWLHIEEDGTLTVYTGKVEVGQNIRTSLAQAVAEELRVPADAVTLVMADTDATPFDPGTVGSRTTPVMAARLRRVAAAARELLLDLAASQFGVERDELAVAAGNVLHTPSGRAIGFGMLTRGRRLEEHYGDDAPITPADDWTVAGSSIPKINGRALVTGKHRYTTDITLPGMLTGRVVRPPVLGATLTSLDTTTVEAMPGVTVVRDDDFVGVVAPDQLAAARASAEVRAEWSCPERPSQQNIFDYLRSHPAEQDSQRFPQPLSLDLGSLDAGRDGADLTLEASYTVAYIAHTPPEPRVAVAKWTGDGVTVWTGTQRPFGVRSELAEALQIPEEQVRVIVPDTGSAYGGKHTGDAAVEAARLARAVRKPVKVVWTRQEEFSHAYFRPAGVIDISSAARSDGTLTAWEFHNYNSGPAGIKTPYNVPNQRVEFHPTLTPLRQGSYRALAATANHFARETHMDELASALGVDPLAFRLHNLCDERMRAVLEAAASSFGWSGARAAPGCGFGIACGTEKGSYVATCAEVAMDPAGGEIKVVRVVQAFECGAVVNPENVRMQNEGCIIQGIGGAIFEEVRFEQGRILSDRYSRYRVPRFADTPMMDVILVDRKDLPSAGAGETPIVGIAPAIGNAIFDATGIRLRSMPLAPHGLHPA